MPAQTAPKRNGILSQYLGLPKQVYLLVFSKMICACGYFVYPYITLYLSQVMGYGTDTIGWCSFAFAMCYVPAALIGGKFSDKFSRKKTYLIYMILGDVFLCLTGILTGILTLTRDVHTAVCMAVWLHGYLAEYGLKYHSVQNFPLECFPSLMDELFRQRGL